MSTEMEAAVEESHACNEKKVCMKERSFTLCCVVKIACQ